MNNILFFDIETNGLKDFTRLSDLECIHSLVIIDNEDKVYKYKQSNLKEALYLLEKADMIVGHNSIGFDYPVLNKLFGFTHSKVYDTMVMAKCIFPDLYQASFANEPELKLTSSHSLKAWGQRLGALKDNHGETEDWTRWTPELEAYCVQDVVVTKKLFKFLMKREPSEQMLELEHTFARVMRKQEYNGFPFDTESANKLVAELMITRQKLHQEFQAMFPPKIETLKSFWYTNGMGDNFPTKKSMIEIGYSANQIFKGAQKQKEIPFNPNSRDQICEQLIKLGWKPKAYDGKRPAINEGVLKEIGTPEALKLCEYLLLTKRLGQIAEGKQAWIKLENNGVLHGRVNTNGTVSGRCSHNNPNVAQVPAVRAPYGKECRSLFTAPLGKVLVGCDASGLELRCLAHYLSIWDEGEYGRKIVEDDIHTVNQKAAGLPTRDDAKTFIYGTIYGAGDAKIGKIVGGTAQDGKRLKNKFKQSIPAYQKLWDAVANKVETSNTLIGLDGRKLPCRSSHSALNLLLQSAGAVIMKQSVVEFIKLAKHPYTLHANIHDEVQFSCDESNADELGQAFVQAIKNAGDTLKFKCPLDGEYNIGNNWAETH
jgi:DNA polymerase I-like protein with 3'-5' exonuclease and polymerase domains